MDQYLPLSSEESADLKEVLGLPEGASTYVARREAFLRCCLLGIPAFVKLLKAPSATAAASGDAAATATNGTDEQKELDLLEPPTNDDDFDDDFDGRMAIQETSLVRMHLVDDHTATTPNDVFYPALLPPPTPTTPLGNGEVSTSSAPPRPPADTSAMGREVQFDRVFYAFECLRDDLKIDDLPKCSPGDFIPSLRPPPGDVPISNMIHARILSTSDVPAVGIVVSMRIFFSTRILKVDRRLSDFQRLVDHLKVVRPEMHRQLPPVPQKRGLFNFGNQFQGMLQLQERLDKFLETAINAMKGESRQQWVGYNVDLLDFLGLDAEVRMKQHRNDMRSLLKVLTDWPESGVYHIDAKWLLNWDSAMQNQAGASFPVLIVSESTESDETRQEKRRRGVVDEREFLPVSSAEYLLMEEVYGRGVRSEAIDFSLSEGEGFFPV